MTAVAFQDAKPQMSEHAFRDVKIRPRPAPSSTKPALRLRRQGARPPYAHRGRAAPPDAAARVEPGEHGEAVIAAVLARLKEHGYLDDKSFAETYARLRQENEKLGAAPRASGPAAERRKLRPDRRNPRRPLRPDKRGSPGPRVPGTQAHPQAGERRKRQPASCAAWSRPAFQPASSTKSSASGTCPTRALAALDNLSEEPHEE